MTLKVGMVVRPRKLIARTVYSAFYRERAELPLLRRRDTLVVTRVKAAGIVNVAKDGKPVLSDHDLCPADFAAELFRVARRCASAHRPAA